MRPAPRKRAPGRCSVQFAQWTAREARLNDAEHIHVGGDRLIRGFSGGAGAGKVASAGQNREESMLRGIGYTASSGMGWVSTQSPTTGYSSP